MAGTGSLPCRSCCISTVKHQRISGHTRRRGVLLVAPNGLNKTWRFRRGRADVDFADAVLQDVMDRYPVDRDNIFVSGYSFGSAMAWRFVCESGKDIRALFAVAGTLRQSEICPQAPAIVRHVHGTSDRVMDFPGGPDGDVLNPVKLWRDRLGCAEAIPDGTYKIVDWLSFIMAGISSPMAGWAGNSMKCWGWNRHIRETREAAEPLRVVCYTLALV